MKQRYIVLLHITFWSLLIFTGLWSALNARVFNAHKPLPLDAALFGRYLVIQLSYLLIPISCFYSSYLMVAPQIAKKHYWRASVYSLLIVAFVTGLRYVIEYHFLLPVMGFDNYNGHPYTFARFVTNVFFYYFPAYFVYGLMYFFVLGWYQTRQHQQELEKEKASAELAFLQSQVNPHFLFNSINDIYSLSYQQSELAPVALLKLSEILRYMLREGREHTVLLQNEIAYLENVIALHRISAKGNASVNFSVEGYVGAQTIATLLLIAFVENAFKHGVWNDRENPIEINLLATPGKIYFRVNNKKNKDIKDKTGGIGLVNVRRRLALIYPGKHELTINENAELYTVNLTVQQS